MKKKIAIFTHGGLGTGYKSHGFPLITQIVNRFADDFDVSVYSLASFNKDFKPQHIKVYSVPRWVKPQIVRWIYLAIMFLRHHIMNRKEVLFSFWGYPTGVVVVLLGKIIRRPTVVTLLGAETANVPEINYGHFRRKIPRELILWTCRNVDQLIAVSCFQIKKLKQCGLKCEAAIVPWGVNKHQFTWFEKNYQLPLKIVHVANLTAVKDQYTLMKAIQLVREKIPVKVRVIGSDFFDGKIQEFVEQLGLQQDVEFIGFIPHDKIAEHYEWADVFMLTSLSEGQNNSITEAMMCGVLPVSTSVGIMDDLGNDVGVVESPGDFERLAEGLVSLYHDREDWNRRLQASKAWASSHDFEWTISQLNELINKL